MKAGTDLLATLGQDLAAKREIAQGRSASRTPIKHGQPQVTPTVSKPSAMPTAIEDVPGSGDNDLLANAPAASTVQDDQPISTPTPVDGAIAAPVDNGSTQPAGTPVEPGAGKNALPAWTNESLHAEMRKAREEAKRSRLEMKDTVDRLQKEYERKLVELQAATKPLEDQARELNDLRAKEADKKRTLEERLAHRENLLADRDEEIQSLKDAHQKELFRIQAQLENLQSEVNVQNQFYEDKLSEELQQVPDKFKATAQRIVKGCDSVREAVDAIRDARAEGLFRDRTIQVSHAVPNVDQGARISGNVQRQEQRDKIEKMTATEKIGVALQGLKSNPIYRGR
jgi:uncharacterized protein YukE